MHISAFWLGYGLLSQLKIGTASSLLGSLLILWRAWFTNTLESLKFTNTLESLKFTNTLESLKFTNTLESLKFTKTLESLKFTNILESLKFTNTLESLKFTNTLESLKFTNTLESLKCLAEVHYMKEVGIKCSTSGSRVLCMHPFKGNGYSFGYYLVY